MLVRSSHSAILRRLIGLPCRFEPLILRFVPGSAPHHDQRVVGGIARTKVIGSSAAQLLLHFFTELLPSSDPGPGCFLVDTLGQSGNAHSTDESAVNGKRHSATD